MLLSQPFIDGADDHSLSLRIETSLDDHSVSFLIENLFLMHSTMVIDHTTKMVEKKTNNLK